MDLRPRLYAESILAGTAEVEAGFIRIVGDSGKESDLPVVEILDEVLDSLPASHQVLI